MRSAGLVVGVAIAAALVSSSPTLAQTGFTPRGAERQRAAEAAALAAIEAADLEAMARTLSARPHVAGTPGQAAVRDSLAAWLRSWGLVAETPGYSVFLPHATAVTLSLIAPERIDFQLVEPPLEGDPATAWPQYPWVNGYSAAGTAEADVVYAGYGLHEDYALLDSIGIDVAGKVVIARYGRSYRGIKARLAGERGAAALLLYSDPEDDGYGRGDPMPQGPMRPALGIQRGSVLDGVGDPTTPEGPSVAGAPRAPARGIAPIPVVPLPYGIASEILSRLSGAGIPGEEWQGGLPFRYHVGPGPARVRVFVDDDRDDPTAGRKDVVDVVTRIEGRELPDEMVVLGAHIDAWGPGAVDNVSGTVSAWAVARALARLVETGARPRRSIVVAGWDGEEWGLIGSTEWVEEHAAELTRGGVAYLNQDAVGGLRFGASASPSLKPLVREAAAAVPAGDGTLYERWQADAALDRPTIGDLGGGSDFAPFLNHLGIPSASHGFGTPGGTYHSHYDTWSWMSRFGDPGYHNHALSAELLAVLALRLANSEILPYDYAAFGEEVGRRWQELRERAVKRGLVQESEPDSLGDALTRFTSAGEGFARERDSYLRGGAGDVDASRIANRALRAVERQLTRPEGLVGRPWYRSLVYAADRRNGYATIALPSIAEAIADGDPARVRAEALDMADRVRRATDSIYEASTAIRVRT